MIELRDFSENDVEDLVRNANNNKVSKYLTELFPYPYTIEHAEWWISTGSKSGIQKAIIHEGKFVGSTGITIGQSIRTREGVIGYWLGEEYWGLGIATHAIKAMTDYAFKNTDIVRISAGVFSPNTGSMRALEKAGYELEAVLKKSIYKDDNLFDEYLYVKFRA